VIKTFKRKNNNESDKYCASMLLDILDYFENIFSFMNTETKDLLPLK